MVRLTGLEWVPRATSHMGCLEGCARYLGLDLSPAWLYGGTGHAFTIVVGEDLCPSGPHSWDYFRTVPALGRNLGLAVEVLAAYPGHPGFQDRQREIWSSVRRTIDDGLPCYGWHHEFIVIAGYDEYGCLLSGPVKARGVGASGEWRAFGASSGPGFVEVATVARGPAANDAQTVRDAFSFAIQSAGTAGQGLAAYDNWIEGLASGQPISEDGVGYHAAIWSECRAYAAAFLGEARTRLPGRCDTLFDRAGEAYGRVRDALEAVSRLFPPCLAAPAPPGQTEAQVQALMAYAHDQARRDRAAVLVREARDAEEVGLGLIEQIVEAL